ncbi:hypothetical protein GF325_18715 [Candidatus Bathyarchaeota archaeon]|nr:hypothetical protein [Candidatus Bathyarchaeota archaeon]
MAEESTLTPRQIGELILDLKEELEEIRMEVKLLDGRLKQGDLSHEEYTSEKKRLNEYMKNLIERITGLQKSISKKDRDLARELRQLRNFFQVDDLGNDRYVIYLAAGTEHLYTINFSLDNYPGKPEIQWPAEVLEEMGDPNNFIKALRQWDPAYPTPVFEIFQAFEQYTWNYFNSVQELKDQLREIEGEFVLQLIRDNYIRITLISFNKKEYSIEIDLQDYPDLKWVFPPDVEAILGSASTFLAKYQDLEQKPKMIDLLHDISWEIDKHNKLSFDFKVLQANASDVVTELKLDPVAKKITGFIQGELKTAEAKFEFVADFSKGYPEKPPEITLNPVGTVDDEVIGKLQHYIADSGANWTPGSFFIDLLNHINMAIFKSSLITCVVCHKLFCPTCDNPLYLPKSIEGKTCHVVCSNCKRPYHKHCFENTIRSIGKCAVCMQSFVAEGESGEKKNLSLDF